MPETGPDALSFSPTDKEFYGGAARAPRSNCVLDVSKLLAAGAQIRPAHGRFGRCLVELGARTEVTFSRA